MPSAMLKPCGVLGGGCGELVESGCCAKHTTTPTTYRGSPASRGYTWAWTKWRDWYLNKLADFGLGPVCGARWPGLPSTGDSYCHEAGLFTATDLQVDHTPALAAFERSIESVVCDKDRVQVLCRTCHNRKTAKERRA